MEKRERENFMRRAIDGKQAKLRLSSRRRGFSVVAAATFPGESLFYPSVGRLLPPISHTLLFAAGGHISPSPYTLKFSSFQE
jgi:hypothetical protein